MGSRYVHYKNAIGDNKKTTFYEPSVEKCWVRVGFGEEKLVDVHGFRYFPRMDSRLEDLRCLNVQGSLNDVEYTSIVSLEDLRSGWNEKILQGITARYRYVRIIGDKINRCSSAEFQVLGRPIFNQEFSNLDSVLCNVKIRSGKKIQELTNGIEYRSNLTPVLEFFSP